jgi:hypothetical protein
MTCRASRLSSATVTFARSITGLPDVQLLSLNHQLMREGSASETRTPTREEWNSLIDELILSVREGRLPVARGSHDPIARLEAARLENPTATRFYAAQNLIRRASLSYEAQSRLSTRYARDLGLSLHSLNSRFQDFLNQADANPALRADDEFVARWNGNIDNAHLPRDRRSLYAYSMIEALRTDATTGLERERAASLHYDLNPSEGDTGLNRVSLDTQSNHVEFLIVSNDGDERIESYQVDDETRATIQNYFISGSGDMSSILDNVRETSEFRYASREEAERNTWRNRCRSCGQFARVSSHSCPVVGSPEAIESDVRAAVENTQALPAVPDRYNTLPLSNTEYLVSNGILVRLPNLRVLRREGQDQLDLRFDSVARVDGFDLTGTMHLEYDGEEDAYHIAAPTRIDNRLRCSCPDYQATRDCSHIDELVDYVNSVVNGEVPADIRTSENEIILSEIATEYADSQNEIEELQNSYPSLKKSFAENPELFQTLYKKAREDKKKFEEGEGEYPIPYIKENALMGFGTRESGRGFGVEIEYAFPSDWSESEIQEATEAIGEELYSLGLTRNRRQGGYGASHGWYRDTHDRGWSYETDYSAGGRDGQAGGEIVSPVMYDETETWENLEKICSVLKSNGAFASRGAGNHIHVGMKGYDHTVANHNRLLNAFARNEDLIYRMSMDPTRGRHRGFGYCSPNSLPSTPYARVSAAAAAQNSHGVALNLQSVRGRDSDHIEFRTFDSTINPAIIQTQIAMSVFMVEGALRGEGRPAPAEGRAPLGERLELNPRRRALTGGAWDETTLGARKFLDEFIPQPDEAVENNHAVKQFIGLFSMTKWQTTRSRRLADLPEDS